MQDLAFDRVFTETQRDRSWLHWTPVEVAERAVALLAPGPDHQVLDVGAGVGKLCLIGAARTTSRWYGIERSAEMVRAARNAARRLGVEPRTSFVHGDIRDVDWRQFDAFYLFNPFGELLLARGDDDADDALTRREHYVACIEYVQARLAEAAPGTRVVTYHGFGGDMPPGYELVHREEAREDELCLWIRAAG